MDYDNDYYTDFRKKRQYGLNVDQDTSLSTTNQQRIVPKDFQLGFNPVPSSSYQTIDRQPARGLSVSPSSQFQVPVSSFTGRM